MEIEEANQVSGEGNNENSDRNNSLEGIIRYHKYSRVSYNHL
jgi:hypothetical protein